MKNLLYKEIRLALHPSIYFFLAFGVLLLIPSWPFFIAFGYLFIGFMNTFITDKSTHDTFFTASLPVPKRDVVRARVYSIAAAEIIQIVVAVPFAFLNARINPHGNVVGMNPNLAFLGFVFLMYAIFNAVFLPMFYRTAYKPGIPMIVGTVASILFAGAVEFAVHLVPFLKANLDGIGLEHAGAQLIALAASVSIFFLVTFLAYRRAGDNFERVDL